MANRGRKTEVRMKFKRKHISPRGCHATSVNLNSRGASWSSTRQGASFNCSLLNSTRIPQYNTMVDVTPSQFEPAQCFDSSEFHQNTAKENEQRDGSCPQSTELLSPVETSITSRGHMKFGCAHYRRRCRVRTPCCNEIFDCRHCHNEAKNNISVDRLLRHDLPRHQLKTVICSLCDTEQEVRKYCVNCGVCMGRYFCGTCKLFDDDTSKMQYHCDGCGICRIGGKENFFHCYKCRCCYSILLKNSHPCVEGAMHHDCPVCFEYLFESRNDVIVLQCGHTIHKTCLKEMRDHFQFACPLCSKSVCDMSKVWERFDVEIAATPMPEQYQNKKVRILCNDCGKNSEVLFHVVAQKCPHCRSYNTRQTRG